ncbi:hypothetical protein [uncultured Micrococcus sp.]|uniref:hypothetical protein n=1 Tax=uncultured Micrococcus sp. TaxID=114051 RepID=UPI00130EB077|nr:hypothetical protein [uncultured Micrococcus sp.]
MTIIRRYRDTTADDGSRLFEYREAWSAPGSGQLTVHHGRVGQPGTVADQDVVDDAEAATLLEAFAAQCDEDEFTPLTEERLAHVLVEYPLRASAPSPAEQTTLEHLRRQITHRLAWRGLGEVVDMTIRNGQAVLTVETPHAAKASAQIPAAAKGAQGVQPNKVRIVRPGQDAS